MKVIVVPKTSDLRLTGRRVVVAGAGGLGGACVTGFLEAGAHVLVVDRAERPLARLRERHPMSFSAGELVTLRVDLTAPDGGERVVESADEAFGGLDVAVHAVGINDRRPVLDVSPAQWQEIIDVNLGTAFRFGQACGRHLLAHGGGRVVFFSSVSGALAHKGHAPYAASKGGVNQMMRVMAHEWAPYGVAVNAVAPGYVKTPLTARHLEQAGVRDELVALVPSGRLGTSDEVVGPVLFLASPLAGFITGQVLYVDGGRTLV